MKNIMSSSNSTPSISSKSLNSEHVVTSQQKCNDHTTDGIQKKPRRASFLDRAYESISIGNITTSHSTTSLVKKIGDTKERVKDKFKLDRITQTGSILVCVNLTVSIVHFLVYIYSFLGTFSYYQRVNFFVTIAASIVSLMVIITGLISFGLTFKYAIPAMKKVLHWQNDHPNQFPNDSREQKQKTESGDMREANVKSHFEDLPVIRMDSPRCNLDQQQTNEQEKQMTMTNDQMLTRVKHEQENNVLNGDIKLSLSDFPGPNNQEYIASNNNSEIIDDTEDEISLQYLRICYGFALAYMMLIIIFSLLCQEINIFAAVTSYIGFSELDGPITGKKRIYLILFVVSSLLSLFNIIYSIVNITVSIVHAQDIHGTINFVKNCLSTPPQIDDLHNLDIPEINE